MERSDQQDFKQERDRLQRGLEEFSGIGIKRFLSLDTQAYQPGALDKKTKELLGLTASLVLRCDDCIKYHLLACRQAGVTDDELREALTIGLIVGGSIVIPHLRRAVAFWNSN